MSYSIRDITLWFKQLMEDYNSIGPIDNDGFFEQMKSKNTSHRAYVRDINTKVIYLYEININDSDITTIAAEASFLANSVDKIQPENIEILDIVKQKDN